MCHREEIADLSEIQRIPIRKRTNLVRVDEFCKVPPAGSGFSEFLSFLPEIKHRTNAASSLNIIIDKIIKARNLGKPISWGLGPHIIKYGLSPLIIELMKYGVVQCILTNGAGAIHDVEIAMIGETSEEMGGHIATGDFGMAQETGKFINKAAVAAMKHQAGFGFMLGKRLVENKYPYLEHSLLAQAYLNKIPMTVHVAIGTDIVHMHPDMDGAATGAATFTDFRKFIAVLRRIGGGGVHLNVGSTVILPEVFVKALTSANNLNKRPARDFITTNIDHLSEYRPLMNVVRRGPMNGGEGYEIIGRMEILIPLLTRILLAKLRNE